VVIQFYDLKNISYLVLKKLNMGALPYKEFFEEW
jgi:hypothetical protein